jgi:hypothetical protein
MAGFLTLLLPAIGKPIDSPEVLAFFRAQDISGQLSVEDDDYETYVERPGEGYSLNVIQQSHVKNPRYRRSERGVLILRGCHFYSEGHEDYHQYQDELPGGIAFTDSRATALRKLGPSAWRYEKDGKIRRERWEDGEADRQLNLTYTAEEQSMLVVYFGIREFFTA